jgi:hypothetical protein
MNALYQRLGDTAPSFSKVVGMPEAIIDKVQSGLKTPLVAPILQEHHV